MADLKPCPFCGGEAELWVPGGPIRCTEPDCEGEASDAQTWNKRVLDEAQQAYVLRRWITAMEVGVARMTVRQRETGEQVLAEMREALGNLGVAEAGHQKPSPADTDERFSAVRSVQNESTESGSCIAAPAALKESE